MTTLTKETPITIGMEAFTMNMGNVVPVRVLENTGKTFGVLGDEYRVRYIGTEPICLDFGQNWFLHPGDVFVTRKVNMDRALEWKARGY